MSVVRFGRRDDPLTTPSIYRIVGPLDAKTQIADRKRKPNFGPQNNNLQIADRFENLVLNHLAILLPRLGVSNAPAPAPHPISRNTARKGRPSPRNPSPAPPAADPRLYPASSLRRAFENDRMPAVSGQIAKPVLPLQSSLRFFVSLPLCVKQWIKRQVKISVKGSKVERLKVARGKLCGLCGLRARKCHPEPRPLRNLISTQRRRGAEFRRGRLRPLRFWRPPPPVPLPALGLNGEISTLAFSSERQ